MTPYDCQLTSKFINERNNWDIETSIVITCGFVQGNCTLNGYKLSPVGYDWAQENAELNINVILMRKDLMKLVMKKFN